MTFCEIGNWVSEKERTTLPENSLTKNVRSVSDDEAHAASRRPGRDLHDYDYAGNVIVLRYLMPMQRLGRTNSPEGLPVDALGS